MKYIITTLKILRHLFIISILTTLGCSSIPTADEMTITAIHPLATYSGEVNSKPYIYRTTKEIFKNPTPEFKDCPEFEAACISLESLYKAYGTNITKQTLSDPFFTQEYKKVYFKHSINPNVVFYYANRMMVEEDGWEVLREGYPMETDGGIVSSLCRVYKKGDKLVRFEGTGFYGNDEEPDGMPLYGFVFSFINMKPEELFGKYYKQKGHEQFNNNLHVDLPDSMEKFYRETTKELKDNDLMALDENTSRMRARSNHYYIYEGNENNWTNSALVVLDMQDFACNPEEGWKIPGVNSVITNINLLAEIFRTNDRPVIWVKHKIAEQPSDEQKLSNEFIAAEFNRQSINAKESKIFSAMQVNTNLDHIVYKSNFSALASKDSELKKKLTELNMTGLTIVGLTANVSVESTIRDAVQQNYNVRLVTDATAAFDETLKKCTESNVNIYFGELITTENLLGDMNMGVKK